MCRINILGGPGLGKSTVAAWLYSELKKRHYSIENVGEYVKSWAIEKRKINPFDQNYIFAKQQHYEYRYLVHGTKNIVTDSPTILSYIYTNHYFGFYLSEPLLQLNRLYENKYPSINILLKRDGIYDTEGRYESAEEAEVIDDAVKEYLENNDLNYIEVDRDDTSGILSYAIEHAIK